MRVGHWAAPLLCAAMTVALGACEFIPPTLPSYPTPTRVSWLGQGWSTETQREYHAKDQGTLTFGIPYEWFVALEQPAIGPAPPLANQAVLDRFGFIPGPSGLPVGFAHGGVYRDPTTGATWDNPRGTPYTGIGLTCAACHTGRMTYRGSEILIDGGSALVSLDDFRTTMGLALLYTDIDPFRFARFARGVLGANAPEAAKALLHSQLRQVIAAGEAEKALLDSNKARNVAEGFGRLDAIDRIGNQLFAIDMQQGAPDPDLKTRLSTNYAPLVAPVHFPHIWTAPWFSWVQYNGSIMQPMVRNAGEALGVRALVNLDPRRPLYDSTVDVNNLYWIEQTLAGRHPPTKPGTFTGLRPPVWPAEFPAIDQARAARGAVLYQELCQGCHLSPTTSQAFRTGSWWQRIEGTRQPYLDLVQVPLDEIGTDPAMARNMAARTVVLPPYVTLSSNGFGLALGDLVRKVTDRWYDTHATPRALRPAMDGDRPNRIRAPLSYKARPLNGIWAVPPYLHNGSVPSLYALLSPVAERPRIVWLGGREFDPCDVGYVNAPIDGGFALDTTLPGNRATGHEFRDAPQGNGVIGRYLPPEQRRDLIEYLKTL